MVDTSGPVDTQNGWCGAVNREQHPHDVAVRQHNKAAKAHYSNESPYGVDETEASPKKQATSGTPKSLAEHMSS